MGSQSRFPIGMRPNQAQFLHQLIQVLLVGLTIGMMRNVVPALAEPEFGVPRTSVLMLVSFVVAFGVVKGILNFVAGRAAERFGRKRVLVAGWVVAIPIPALIFWAPNWSWIVLATILLGINQGLTWSMTQTSKLDLTHQNQRGLVIGLNEFSGYLGVALAGILTGYMAADFGPRIGLLWFGSIVILSALLLSVIAVRDTAPWVRLTAQPSASNSLTTWAVFKRVSWTDRRLAAVCQAGLVEKFVDALVWILWPIYLYDRGLPLPTIGWVVAAYGMTWGIAQLLTGRLSDRIGRQPLNVWGMWLCGVGVLLFPHSDSTVGWSVSAVITGLGMAMLYPNLSAAIADLSDSAWRASAIGIYRFWRDLGYAVGALGLGLAAHMYGASDAAYWFVGLSMMVSGFVLKHFGTESHPGLSRLREDC